MKLHEWIATRIDGGTPEALRLWLLVPMQWSPYARELAMGTPGDVRQTLDSYLSTRTPEQLHQLLDQLRIEDGEVALWPLDVHL